MSIMTHRWDPFSDFRRLGESLDGHINRLLGVPGHDAFPRANIWRREDSILITSQIPGLKPDDLEVTVVSQTITLKGEVGKTVPENSRIHRQERETGAFCRTFRVPFRLDPDSVQAKLENGVLTITASIAQSEKPRKINVTSA